ncbi:cysteine protease [Brevundimonas sp. NPDC092305]|uniref:cysteine protease n=1 Tax=Brevundimonas sp. NPDC092305 TaxID=3363957 RepID=UPI003821E637
MALSRIATALGGLLLSKGGRRFAGRHAGKLALATLAWELYQQRQAGKLARPSQSQTQGRSSPKSRRWSGRKARGL